MLPGPQPRRKIVTNCCRASYKIKFAKFICKECSKECALMKDDGYRPPKGITDFGRYKPPEGMTWKERNEESLKRTSLISEYTNSIKGISDTTERNFILGRIKWNEDRISLLLG